MPTKNSIKALDPLPMLDQDELVTLNGRLQLHCANLRAMAQAKGTTPPPAPAIITEDIIATAEALIAHGSALEVMLGSSAPEFLGVMPKQEAARQLAAHPAFRPTPTPAPAPAASASTPTAPAPEILAAQLQRDGSTIVTVKLARPSATERLLAAEGVKTLAELAQKRDRERAAKYSAKASRLGASRPKKTN